MVSDLCYTPRASITDKSAEIETSIVLSQNHNPGNTMTPHVWSQHWANVQGNNDLGSNLTTALCDFTFNLSSQYQHSVKFTSQLGNFLNRVRQGDVPTIRKAELELIKLGKVRGCSPEI
jgi:hypothetical protein